MLALTDLSTTRFAPDGPVAILGGAGGGVVTAEYLVAAGAGDRILGFLNDKEAPGQQICGYDVLGGFEDWKKLPSDTQFCAPVHKVKQNEARAARIAGLDIPEDRWAKILHPYCAVASSAQVGPGASIGAFSDLQPGVVLGRHVAMRSNVYLAHDTMVGDFVFIGAGVSIAGYGRIGNGAFIGINAAIREDISVGAFAVVGAGASVARDVADYEIVAGNPARRIGYVSSLEGRK